MDTKVHAPNFVGNYQYLCCVHTHKSIIFTKRLVDFSL